MTSTAPAARCGCPICSAAGAAHRLSLHVPIPTGTRDARAARTGPTITSGSWSTCVPRTPTWFGGVARPALPRSRRSANAWAGPSNGSRAAPTASSITISAPISNKEDLAKEGNNTNYGTRRFTIEDVPAISVFLQGPGRRPLSHLLDLFARPRHAQRRLSLPRYRS